jgi:hypothetical protein
MSSSVLCHPSIPVLLRQIQCAPVILHLAKREFVNDRIVVRINEYAWRYPRLATSQSLVMGRLSAEYAYLENKPASTDSKSQMASNCMGSAQH